MSQTTSDDVEVDPAIAHEWGPSGAYRDDCPILFCPHCRRKLVARGAVAIEVCPARDGRSDAERQLDELDRQSARRGTFETWPCVHRGDVVGSVPCGKCYDKETPVEVRGCAVHGLCVAKAIASTEAQRIDGVRPTRCGKRCAERTEPDVSDSAASNPLR